MPTNVLVSTKPYEIDGFLKFTSTSALADGVHIGTLIYNVSNEDPGDAIAWMSSHRIDKIYYISSTPLMPIRTYFIGKDAPVIEDEFFLEDPDLLSELLDDSEAGKEVALTGDRAVIDNFVDRVIAGDENEFSAKYLELVTRSMGSVMDAVDSKESDLVQVARAGLGLFEKAHESTRELANRNEQLQETLAKLKDASASVSATGRTQSGGVLGSYPPVPYTGKMNAVMIKEIGTVPYLTSFALGLQAYLRNKNILKTTVLIVVPPGSVWHDMYKNVPNSSFITKENYSNIRNLVKSDLIFLSYPVQRVISTITKKKDDYLILLDRTSNTKDMILRTDPGTRGVRSYYACQSKRIVSNMKLPLPRTFSSVSQIEGSMFTIPAFSDYPTRVQSRERAYLDECSSMYRKMIGN